MAAAGETEGLRPRAAALCLAAVVLGVLAIPALSGSRNALARVPVEKSPATLEDRARDLMLRLGPGKPVDSEVGFRYDTDYLRWAAERDRSANRWDSLATGDPPLVGFWYRQSPRSLQGQNLSGRVSWTDPEPQAGMAGASYDLQGRLLSFYVVTPQLEQAAAAPAPAAEPDWTPFFSEARLDPARFERVPPRWTPPFYADARAAWEGHWPSRPELPLRVEAAAYRGRPVWFEIKNAWTRPEREQVSSLTAGPAPPPVALHPAAGRARLRLGLLAYHNISLGRGDRHGAFRLALALATLATLSWALRGHHVVEPTGEIAGFARGAGMAVLVASLLWLFYLALEPYVRRLRPWTLVSWTRLLNGGIRDAVVGRDVLMGLAFGTGLTLVSLAARAADRLGGPAGARAGDGADRHPARHPAAAELRGRPARERDTRGPRAAAVVPDPAARHAPGLDRRGAGGGVSRRGRPRRERFPAERVADAAARRGRLGSRSWS